MKTRRTSLRRLAAGAGALSLAMVGLAGTAAMAATPGGDNESEIVAGTTGSLTIHKSSNPETDAGDGTNKGPVTNPLEGVEFTVTPVLSGSAAIDLSTADGWLLAEQLFASAAPALPGGFALGSPLAPEETDSDGVAFFDELPIGVYLVEETGSGDNIITKEAVPFWVSIPYPNSDNTFNYNVHVYPKNVVGELVSDKTTEQGPGELEVGTQVDWTISVTVPQSGVAYDSFTLQDAGSANLDFVSWGTVSVGIDELTEGTDYTVTDDLIEFTDTGMAALNAAAADGPVTVTAVVTTEVTGTPDDGEIVNEAEAKLNGNPTTPTGQTNTGQLTVNKIGETGDAILKGAEFAVYADFADGEPATGASPVATGTTDSDGNVSWWLWVGNDTTVSHEYLLCETKAPAGYVLPAQPCQVVNVTAGETAEVGYDVQVTNHKPEGPNLPLTGSTGTLLFTIVGIGLIATGGVIAAVRHNRSKA